MQNMIVLCISLLFIINNSVAQELPADANTLLLLRFNNSTNGQAGEVASTANNISYSNAVHQQGADINTNSQLTYSAANNINSTVGSIECWVKPNWNGNDGLDHTLLQFGFGGGMLIEKDAANNFKAIFNRYSANGNIEKAAVINISDWVANQWYHVVYTWDSDKIQLYINAVLKNTGYFTYPIPVVSETTFNIGSDNGGKQFDGLIDELRISNKVRTSAEIVASFKAGFSSASSLSVTPNQIKLLPTWKKELLVDITTNLGTFQTTGALLNWNSTNASVANVVNGKVEAYNSGNVTLTGTFSNQSIPINVEVEQPVLAPVHEDIPAFLAAPSACAIESVPVVIIRYLPTVDGINLDGSKAPNFHSIDERPLSEMRNIIDKLDLRIKFSLEESSKFRGYKDAAALPYLGYQVVEYITVYEQTPPGKVIGNEQGFPIYQADFFSIFERFNLADFVNNQGVKEIWFWENGMGPGFPSYDSEIHDPVDFRGNWESNMSSPTTGDISNSNRDNSDLPIYDHTYVLYGQNIRRSQAEAIHNHGHQLESIYSYIANRQDGNDNLFWEKFVGRVNNNAPIGRCGDTHHPPNTTSDYDYTNSTLVESDIEDWRPDGLGAKKMVNADTWGNLNYSWPGGLFPDSEQRVESQYYLYWMQNMPGMGNTILHNGGFMTNWWEFTADWDKAIQENLGLHAPIANAAESCPVLAIDWLEFSAEQRDKQVLLNWKSAQVDVLQQFEIQRSNDGKHFNKIGVTTDKNGHSSFIDQHPLAINYYRIAGIDTNGEIGYSVIRKVEFIPQDRLSLFPNPTKGELIIESNLDFKQAVEITVFDATGKLVIKKIVTPKAAIQLSTLSLEAGVYLLVMEQQGYRQQRTFVKLE